MSFDIRELLEQTLGVQGMAALPRPDLTLRPLDATFAWAGAQSAQSETERGTAPSKPPAGYRPLGPLGIGGMGVVECALQPGLEREVAVKRIREELAQDPRLRAAFVAEARVLGVLDHPNVVPVHELIQQGDDAWLSMKLVRGRPWSEVIERAEGARDIVDELQTLLSVSNAVAFAHSKGIIHRDLKPENVMIGEFGEVLVMDWGLAVRVGDDGDPDGPVPHASSVRGICGTPCYMAPEMAQGLGAAFGPWTDIYLLGAILYELITCQRPHRGDTLIEVVASACRAEEPSFAEDVPRDLADVCRKAMAKNPDDRFQRVTELQEAIRRHLQHRESLRMTQHAEAQLRSGGDRHVSDPQAFQTLNEAVSGFRQALTLWEENPEARAGERSARLLQADWALKAEDFGLVDVVLGDLDDDEARSRRALGEAGLRRRIQAISRVRTLRRMVIAAAVVVIVGLSVGLLIITSERDRADRNASRWKAALTEVGRLSDVTDLARLEREALSLWPAVPTLLPQLEVWLRRAQDLIDRLPEHHEALAILRTEALPYTASARGEDFPEQTAQIERDRKWCAELTAAADAAPSESQRSPIIRYRDGVEAVMRTQIAALEKQRKWHFSGSLLQWRHDVLADLVQRLERWDQPGSSRHSVLQRLDLARRLSSAQKEDEARWDTALAALATDPRFADFSLTPQIGMRPLGADPRSGLQEFLHLASHSGPDPHRDAAGRLSFSPETGIILVLIPPGRAVIGAQPSDAQSAHFDPAATPHEHPVHEVDLDPYFLSKYEMTQAQWTRLTGANPSKYGPGFRDEAGPAITLTHPVEQVSWADCDRVLREVDLEIPTEVQWEYGARAGTQRKWFAGDDMAALPSVANLADLAAFRAGSRWGQSEEAQSRDDGYYLHAPVDSLDPNPFGLHHVHGNLWEWCRDWFDGYGVPVSPGDGQRIVFRGRGRAMRGGSYVGLADEARISNRYDTDPVVRVPTIGIRPSRSLRP